LQEGEVEEEMFGISLGKHKAEICSECGESFVDEAVMDAVEKKAKQLGIWGLAKKIKIVRSGNSLAIRIPADVAKFLKLQEGKEMLLHPEGTTKLAIEII